MLPEGGSFLVSKEMSSQGTPGKTQDCKGIACPDGKLEVEWRCSDWEESK